MQRLLFMLLLVALLFEGALLTQQQQATAATITDCVDIPAFPNYLDTNSEQDAIAAINNARQQEHLHPLHLPTNFYQLDPAQQQFILLNLERTDRGLHPLTLDVNLSQVAYAYSKQLLDLNFFSHTSPIGGTFSDRVNDNPAIANHYSQAAENLAGNPVPGAGAIYEYMYNDSVEACGHRKNILDPGLTMVGIGWLPGSPYGSISAQEFITPASWNPYRPVAPDQVAPQVSIEVVNDGHFLRSTALAQDSGSAVRITWFLDRVGGTSQAGSEWMLDLCSLSPGEHTLLVYAVDEEQNYGVARYSFRV